MSNSANPTVATDAHGAGGRRKMVLIVALAAIGAAASAGGAAWYFLGAKRDGQEPAPSAEPAKKAPPVFHALELFTVNLQDEDGDRYAQVGIVLELASAEVLESVKAQLPVIRNDILLLLSSKRAAELVSAQAKAQLAREIAAAARRPLPATPGAKAGAAGEGAPSEDRRGVEGVYFSTFIIQ